MEYLFIYWLRKNNQKLFMKKEYKLNFSLIIPVFNEEASLPSFHNQLLFVVNRFANNYEIIYVNDGSSDKSMNILNRFAINKRVRVIHLQRNYGQTSAISAGIDKSKYNILVFLDADMQNDPRDIPKLLTKINEGYDVVSGWRKNRYDDFFTKVLPSKIANFLLMQFLRVPIHDFGCTLKAYKKSYLNQVRLYGEMHRLLPYVAQNEGAKITEIIVRHHPRKYGKSHYSLDRTFKVIIDMIMLKLFFDYASKPAYIFGSLGLLTFGTSLILAIITLWEKIFLGAFVHRNPIFLLSLFALITSVQFLLLGFLTEFIMRTYFESQNKPIYKIKSKNNFK